MWNSEAGETHAKTKVALCRNLCFSEDEEMLIEYFQSQQKEDRRLARVTF